MTRFVSADIVNNRITPIITCNHCISWVLTQRFAQQGFRLPGYFGYAPSCYGCPNESRVCPLHLFMWRIPVWMFPVSCDNHRNVESCFPWQRLRSRSRTRAVQLSREPLNIQNLYEGVGRGVGDVVTYEWLRRFEGGSQRVLVQWDNRLVHCAWPASWTPLITVSLYPEAACRVIICYYCFWHETTLRSSDDRHCLVPICILCVQWIEWRPTEDVMSDRGVVCYAALLDLHAVLFEVHFGRSIYKCCLNKAVLFLQKTSPPDKTQCYHSSY